VTAPAPARAKPAPVPTPETQPYWDGCAAGELRLQRCADCSEAFFYPRPVCPACGSAQAEWFTASGRATLYSYVINHRAAPGTPMISQMVDFTESQAFRLAGRDAFAEAGITTSDVNHLMIYDAFAHVPIYGLEALGFVKKGEAGGFISDGNTEPGGSLPLNTNGGGLSYAHTGMYGMFAIQEGVRQVRGEAAAQVDGVDISVVLGNGGMFATSGVLVLGRGPR
jgi:acetyl-CoA acetyltransferase